MNQSKPTAGELIKKARKLNGLTITKLAELTAVSQPYLSQIENDKRKPSYEVIRKIIPILNLDFHLLAWASELYSDREYQEYLEQKDIFESMTPEEEKKYFDEQNKEASYYQKLIVFQKRKYVQIEDFLKNSKEGIYINGHKLTDNEIKMLIHLFEGKEKNYPSDGEVKKEFDELREERIKNIEKIKNGEGLLISKVDDYFDYDLD
ncbi:helix-turn-helix domain-containing protein [Lysinibacillus sp. NPDC056959]|uniref:helix-turn-helix domain-containing protein n=1 Tax=Lysinibacillus sp. NPDC056959 TaxID=3345981 RepID=UPI0036327282